MARLTLSVFIEYVFGRTWEAAFEPLVAASWEWRKEIAVRGKAGGSLRTNTPPTSNRQIESTSL